MSSKEQVIEAALKLSEEERLEIATVLYDSLEAPPDDRSDEEWEQEIQRRVEAADSGQTKAIPWEEAWRQMMKEQNGR